MAARFWIGPNGGDNLWGNVNNWSATSGGATAGAIPTNADDVTFDGAANNACTLATTARVAKTLTVASGYTNTITFNIQLSVSGSITIANSAHTMTGSSALRMIAAGTWTTNGKTITGPVEIGGTTTFTCTLADALTVNGTLLLTNSTSTIFAGAFDIAATTCTISGSQTITLSGNVQVNGLTTLSDANVVNGAFEWRTWNLTTSGALTGTAKLVFNQSGGTTLINGGSSNSINIDFNCPGSSINSSINSLNYTTGTITYIDGTFNSNSFEIIALGSCTIDLQAQAIKSVVISAAATITLPSQLVMVQYMTLPNAAVTFAGAGGWTVGTLQNTAPSANRIYTFANGVTYTVTTVLDLNGTTSFTITLTSDHATNKAIIILGTGADQDNSRVNPTRIDSSGGRPIFSYSGSITTCFNWFSSITSLLNLPTNRAQTHLGV